MHDVSFRTLAGFISLINFYWKCLEVLGIPPKMHGIGNHSKTPGHDSFSYTANVFYFEQ